MIRSDIAIEGNPASMSPCGVGERGVLVLTTLWPKATPLQRYWRDDVVAVVQTASGGAVFRFDYIGRPLSMLQTYCGQIALSDIDDLLLGSGWCGPEWSVRHSPDGVCVEAEMLTRAAGAVRNLADALVEIVGGTVELIPKGPGSLPRATPEFRVIR